MVGTALKIITTLLPVKDSDKLYDLTEHREKRTLSQNALYYKFVGMVADAMKLPKPTVHNMMLREFSNPQVFGGKIARVLLPDNEEAEEKALKSETVHLRPTSQTTTLGDGITYRTYVVLKGSSDMNTKEMSVLVDGILEEAKNLGIETIDPRELERIRRIEEQRNAQKDKSSSDTNVCERDRLGA